MKYEVTHSCGHEQTHQLFGKHSERDNKVSWLEGTLCTDCRKEEQAQQRKEASEKASSEAKEIGLPALTGSDKQIAWAEALRAEIISQLPKFENFEKIDEFQIWLFSQTSAKFWIDGRERRDDEYNFENIFDVMNSVNTLFSGKSGKADVSVYAARFLKTLQS
jgi:hypothetical protein